MMTHARRILRGFLLIGFLLVPTWAAAQSFSSGSTGVDGAFNPPAYVPPGTTVSGSTYTVPLPPTGIYNFTTINVASGLTVTFTRNAANTPVILLATGNVTIAGVIDVSGSAGQRWARPGQGGPGGFDGGAGGDGISVSVGGTGLGPGGGGGGSGSGAPAGGGGYGGGGASGNLSYNYFGTIYPCCSSCSVGAGGSGYGSSLLRPTIGGSGGGGSSGSVGSSAGSGGGGGGGAILIASSTSITITSNPAIRADGGQGAAYGGQSGGGSGGAIRLVAPTITGNGQLYAQAGSAAGNCGGRGGDGRIRLEATTLSYTGSSTPLAVASLPQPLFPPAGQPSLAIASVGGVAAPANPSGSVLTTPDITLPPGTASPVAVVLIASNVPLGTAVQVVASPQNAAKTTATCTLLDGTLASSTCTASIDISLTQTSVLTASATFALVASAGSGPIYAEGEEVKWVRVASVLGGRSVVTYITASGKEVPAAALAGRMP